MPAPASPLSPPSTGRSDEWIRWLTAQSYRHCWWFLASAALLVAGSAALTSRLELRSSFVELLPSNLPSVRNLSELLAHVGGDGTVLVSVEADGEALDGEPHDGEAHGGPDGLQRLERWTSRLGAEFRAMGPKAVRSVLDNLTETQNWYADHWPLFVPTSELQRTQQSLQAEVHRRKLAANPLNLNLDDEASSPTPAAPLPAEIAPWLDGSKPLPREQVLESFARYDHGFMVTKDRRSTAILIRPNGTSLSVGDARTLMQQFQAIVDRHQAELAHDHLRVGFAGSFPLLLASYQAIMRGIFSTALLVIVLEMLVLLVFFREVRPVLALLFAALVAVLIDFGLTRLVIGYLNTQTAFLGAIVVGNGINYGLVYLSRVRQQRAVGTALPLALADGAVTSARATLLAALGSTVSFGVLAIASNRGFRHFAFIGGVGMFLCWVCTFALVPAFFAALERLWPLRTHFVRALEHELPEKRPHPLLARLFARPVWLVTGSFVLMAGAVALFLAMLPKVMETNLRKLDNRLTTADDRQLLRDNDRTNDALGTSAEGAVALLPTPADADAYCEVVRQRAKVPEVAALIDRCETLSSVVPRDETDKLTLIQSIAAQLSDALLATLPPAQRQRASEVRDQLRAQRPVTTAEAPAVLVDRFREADGTLGNLATITSKPEARLEEGPKLIAFANAVRQVPAGGKTYDASGEQVVIADLWKDIYREGPRTTLLSFLGVCFLVLFFFRSWWRRTEVLVTLLGGVLLMAGAGTLLGFKINFFNVIVFPVTFGIAVDYGANVSSRISARAGAVLPALAEVGPAVLVCSVTSIVGYASLLISVNQALQSFGRYAMVGEVTSIATALLFLPALALLRGRLNPGKLRQTGGSPTVVSAAGSQSGQTG